MMSFAVDAEGENTKEINLELRHNVHFVTAFPCVSSHHTELIKSPKSPSFHSSQHSPTGSPRDFSGMLALRKYRGNENKLINIKGIHCTKLLRSPKSPSQHSSSQRGRTPLRHFYYLRLQQTALIPHTRVPTLRIAPFLESSL
jgi:hypothetical protein